MNAHAWEIAGGFPAWVWRNSWQAALVALAVLLAQAALGKRLGPGWRYALWMLVALRLLLPGVPASRTSVYNVVPPAAHFAPRQLRTALGFQGDAGDADAPQASQPAPMSAGTTTASPVKTGAQSTPIPWRRWLALGWLAGAVWLLAILGIATSRLHSAIRRDRRAPSPQVAGLLNEAAAALHMRTPEAVETAAIDVPGVMGLMRPVVILPAGLEKRFTPGEIRFLLLHELAHIRSGDLWTNFLARILQALHWFNPLLWLAFRRMRLDRESACDARVLAIEQPENRAAYGRTLIKVLENLQPAMRHPGVVGILEGRGQFRERLLGIAGYVKPTRFAMAGGLLVMATLAATLLTRAEEKAASAKPASSATQKESGPSYVDKLHAAATAGNGPLIENILDDSFKGPGFSEAGATQLLNSLVAGRELKAFQTLLAELRQTNLGKDWQPNDELLAGLVKDGRTDFIDVLLDSALDLKRLDALKGGASPETAAWIVRRVAETDRKRSDIHKLILACKAGDVETVRKLLDAGVDINGREPDGSWVPLAQAAREDKVEVVRLLLARGAQPDLPKYPGWDYTPLCLTSSIEVANLLKAAGANVHANLFRRKTSILTYVAMFNGAPMVQWFLDQGLDPKMIGDNDETLLFNVKDQATAEILLKAGVDPNRPNEFGQVPLQEARNAGVVEALVKGGAKFTGLKDPLIPGMIQFSSGDAIEEVLKLGPPVDQDTLQKALISAAHMDKDDTALVLLNHGAKANEPGLWSKDDPMLPLFTCCIFGSAKTAKVLLDHGADPNAGKFPGQMLKVAVHNQYKDVAKVLKDAGAKGVSDLAYALAIGDQKQIDELLKTAPMYSDNPGFWDDVLPSAAERGNLTLVRTAIEKGAPVLDKDTKVDAYYSAAFEGQWEVLDYLLKLRSPKSDPEELDQALWGAVWNCNPYPNQRPAAAFEKTVRILIAAGAPMHPKEGEAAKYGVVPTAVFSRYPGSNVKVIEMLVAAGADPNPEVEKGKRLTDEMSEACKQQGCSTPNEETVLTMEKLAHVAINRGK